MSVQRVKLELSLLEAQMLSAVAGNGWGDGDFAQYLGDKKQSNACERAMAALRTAVANAKGQPRRSCDLCSRPFGDRRGECFDTGSRGCKVAQGKQQLTALRTTPDNTKRLAGDLDALYDRIITKEAIPNLLGFLRRVEHSKYAREPLKGRPSDWATRREIAASIETARLLAQRLKV